MTYFVLGSFMWCTWVYLFFHAVNVPHKVPVTTTFNVIASLLSASMQTAMIYLPIIGILWRFS